MKRQIPIGWLLGLLLFVLGGAPAQAITLRYQPKVGTTTQSNFSMTGTMEMSAGKTVQTADTSLNAVAVEKVLAIVPGGRRVQSELRDARLNVNFQGMASENKSQKLPDMSFVSIIDDRGRTKKIVSSSLSETEVTVGERYALGTRRLGLPAGQGRLSRRHVEHEPEDHRLGNASRHDH